MRLPACFQGFPPLAEVWRGTRQALALPRARGPPRPGDGGPGNDHSHHARGHHRAPGANLIDLARLCERDAGAIDWERLAALGASSADVARSLAFPFLYLAREGLPSAPAGPLVRIHAASGLGRWSWGPSRRSPTATGSGRRLLAAGLRTPLEHPLAARVRGGIGAGKGVARAPGDAAPPRFVGPGTPAKGSGREAILCDNAAPSSIPSPFPSPYTFPYPFPSPLEWTCPGHADRP